MINWQLHKKKQEIRKFVLPDNPITNGIVVLPAQTWLDVTELDENKKLNDVEIIYAVEKELEIYQEMELNSPKHLPVKCVKGKLEKLKLNHSIDYAYLDFLGGMARPVALWMQNSLSNQLTENATVAITQIYATRGSGIIPEQDEFLRGKEGRDIRGQRYKELGHLDKRMQRLLCLIHRIFNMWDFTLEVLDEGEIPIYQDVAHKMIVFKLVDFRKLKPNEFHYQSI